MFLLMFATLLGGVAGAAFFSFYGAVYAVVAAPVTGSLAALGAGILIALSAPDTAQTPNRTQRCMQAQAHFEPIWSAAAHA